MFRKLLPALAAPLLLAAACGSSGDALRVETGSPIAALQAAPNAAAQAGSAHIELTMWIAAPDTDDTVAIEASGDYDLDAKRMSMQMDFGQALAGLVPGAASAMPDGFDEPMRFVMDDTTVYVQIPFLASFTGTSDWLSMPLDGLSESGLGQIGAGTFDPAAMLDYLRGAGDVTEEGHEEIDGVDTTKYTATVDLDKALAEVPEAQRGELQDKIDELGTSLAALPITVWVDADGLPRRMQLTVDAPKVGAMTMTMTWSKYGEPVSIDVPDPADVTPAKDTLGGLAGSFLGQG